MCVQTRKPESLRLLRGEAPRKRSTRGSEDVSEAELITGRSIAEEAGTTTENILMNMKDRRWSWLGHTLRMDEDRLMRKVLLNCFQPPKESQQGDIPDLDAENAIEIARDREKWKKIRSSQRC